MEILFLGTGHAISTRCYNTCYVLRQNERYLLVDGGGGNGILRQLKRARLPWQKIKDIFVTHRHMDHVLGVFWGNPDDREGHETGHLCGRSPDLRPR